MAPYRIVEHTADAGIHVTGGTLEELFSDAARGMMSVICEVPPEGWPETHVVELSAPDAESLIVDWLAELLYLLEVKNFFTTDPRVEKVEGGAMRAVVGGARLRGVVHATEIKAVTHHMISVDRTMNGFETTIYFDL